MGCAVEKERESREGYSIKVPLGKECDLLREMLPTSLMVTLENFNLKATYSDIALNVFYGSHDRGLHSMAPHN